MDYRESIKKLFSTGKWNIKTLRKKLVESPLADRMGQDYSLLFLPYVGPDYGKIEPKILYVGQSPQEWVGKDRKELAWDLPKLWEVDNVVEMSDEFIEKKEYLPMKPFWKAVYRITLSIQENKEELLSVPSDSDELRKKHGSCFNSIAWTNLFKISMGRDRKGGPDEDMIDFLQKKFDPLKAEIKCLKPDLIIFFTGTTGGYDEYLSTSLEISLPKENVIENMNVKDLTGLIKHIASDCKLAVRCRHPGGKGPWKDEEIKKVYRYIYDRLNGRLKGPYRQDCLRV